MPEVKNQKNEKTVNYLHPGLKLLEGKSHERDRESLQNPALEKTRRTTWWSLPFEGGPR
jgi:hypothetical protein